MPPAPEIPPHLLQPCQSLERATSANPREIAIVHVENMKRAGLCMQRLHTLQTLLESRRE